MAVLRGPLVYCAEEADCGHGLNRIGLAGDVAAARTADLAELAGAVALDLPVTRDRADWGSTLYRATPPRTEPGNARLVPYHLWDNRTPGEMLVWLRAHNPEG